MNILPTRLGKAIAGGVVLWVVTQSSFHAAVTDNDSLPPWRKEDHAYSNTLTDDRPNEESVGIKAGHFTPLIPERGFNGVKGNQKFRVAPRAEGWAGILILDAQGKPLPKSKMKVEILDATSGKGDELHRWSCVDGKTMFSDVSRVYPKTLLRTDSDEVTIDFSEWKLEPSLIQASSLMDGPTTRKGLITAENGNYMQDGKQIYLWGGHENHVPTHSLSDSYAEVFSEAGLNVMRHLGLEEGCLKDPLTGEVDSKSLDDYHYLVAKLGEKGVYFMLSHTFQYVGERKMSYGYAVGTRPAHPNLWLDPKIREGWKKFLKNALTVVNPYNGKALKDDPTVVGLELANETGLNERRMDYNRVDLPEVSEVWRKAFNAFLLKKYGNRDDLAKAWEKNPLLSWEDPVKNTVMIPTNYRGPRTPYGGTGQHDQFTIGTFYFNGLPKAANPRIVDAVEFHTTVGAKEAPFQYNNPADPAKSEEWRKKFNEFLLRKYGDRKTLATAWAEDELFPWEDPIRNTILIPSNYHGEKEFKEDLASRIADPRIGDAIEFTYAVQKDWATDMANFLRNEVGWKHPIGWNGDAFHVVQTPNHKANMDSPLDIAISSTYQDTDTGDQLTSRVKNLKRFNTYGHILGRPMFAYEWSAWNNSGPYVHEYVLLASLMGRVYGFDGFAHHKMTPYKYPISDPEFSMKNFVAPLSDRRRGAFSLARWILARSKIEENRDTLIIGYPDNSAFTGGPLRRMSNPAFENWLLYTLGSEDYSFKEIYDGPTDRVVIHDGHGPYGDYRKARHAILWCHSNSDREGKDPKAKEKWFKLHGIEFKPGEKYFLNDQFFATTEDMTDYNVVHTRAEKARHEIGELHKRTKRGEIQQHTINDDYWAAEKDTPIPELDRQLYRALKKWGYPVPIEEAEIDKLWRNRDRSMVMDTTKLDFQADREDMQMWFGRMTGKDGVHLSKLEAKTGEKQYSVALIPWDTADFKTAKTLMLWTQWNSQVTVKLPLPKNATVYAVNWLGKRIYKVKPLSQSENSIQFMTARDDDIFCYEIVR